MRISQSDNASSVVLVVCRRKTDYLVSENAKLLTNYLVGPDPLQRDQ